MAQLLWAASAGHGGPRSGHVAANGIARPGTASQTTDSKDAAAVAAPAARVEPALWGSRWAAGLALGQRKALERAAVEICADTQRSSALSKGLGSEQFTEVYASVLKLGRERCSDFCLCAQDCSMFNSACSFLWWIAFFFLLSAHDHCQ